MPIEIRELLIRTLWGADDEREANTKPESKAVDITGSEKQKPDDSVDIEASVRKMLEQTQER